MSNWLRLKILIDFIKELFFDKPNEANFTSSQFNPRKFMVLCLVICLVSLSSLLVNRIHYLVKKVQEQTEALMICYPYINKHNTPYPPLLP